MDASQEPHPRRTSQPQYGMRREQCQVTMRDGVRLAATLYKPEGAPPQATFPALLEYLPYRKDDGSVLRELPRYTYYVQRGYVGMRVDIRGTGASEGVADDEYSTHEGQDALEVIAWLAAQPWCNGHVGMWGISYGGFNAIQIAMLQPPALKAIIAVDATDDVYTDDVVYWNGALQCEALGRWPLSMIVSTGLPGAPDYDVDSLAAQARFAQEPWILAWLRQQRDGPYWRRMSLRPRYEAITIPTMLIGGWLDGYTDSIPRMLAALQAPSRAIIGPWPHAWPEEARPGPGIDARHEMLRWWDLWLKGHDTGLMDEPRLAIYVQHSYPPQPDLASIPGQWRYEEGWPVARVHEVAWYPHPNGTLAQHLPGDFVQHLLYQATLGASNRYRVPHNPAELCRDQRVDDVYSLSFTSLPLTHELEILGFPRAMLHVSTSARLATWIVRLSDVAPDGSSQLVSKGILPGTHRTSHTAPTPLTPGTVYEVALDLKVTSWVFATGHRMRVSISNADFPNLWPSPLRMTTQLYGGASHPSRLLLPLCPFAERPRPRFSVPETAPAPPGRPAPVNQWQTTRDDMRQTVTVFRETRVPAHQVPSEDEPLTVSAVERRWCTASDVEPAHASMKAEGQRVVRRGQLEIVVKARLTIHSDETAFHVIVQRELIKNGTRVRHKRWQETIARDHI